MNWFERRYPFMLKKYNSREIRRYAEFENNRQWQDIFNRNVNMVVDLFQWENLPETCDEHFFERLALFRGTASIVWDEDMQAFLSLPCVIAGGRNLYYENSYYRAYSLGYSKEFIALTHYNKDILEGITQGVRESVGMKGVVLFDNPLQYPMIETVEIFTQKMADSYRSIDVAKKQLKSPAIIETDEDTKLAIEEALRTVDTNGIAVYASRDLKQRLNETKPINTYTNPSNIVALWDTLNNEESKFLSAFGINNLNGVDKKERLLVDEVNSNNQANEINIRARLEMREHFCRNFNEVFADKISKPLSVKVREGYSTSGTPERKVKNVNVYDDASRDTVDT